MENNYMVGMWLAAAPKGAMNWLATVTRAPNGDYIIKTRLRLENDDRIFDSQDDKLWRNYMVPAAARKSEDEIIKQVIDHRAGVTERLSAVHKMLSSGDTLEWEMYDLPVQSADSKVMLEKLKGCPYVHITSFQTPKDPSLN